MSAIDRAPPEGPKTISPKAFVEKITPQGHTFTNISNLDEPINGIFCLKYKSVSHGETAFKCVKIFALFCTGIGNLYLLYLHHTNSMDDGLLVKYTIYHIDITSMKHSFGLAPNNNAIPTIYMKTLETMTRNDLVNHVKDYQSRLDQQRDHFAKSIGLENQFANRVKDCTNIRDLESGTCGVYLAQNEDSTEKFIVKPADEAQTALHNGRNFATVLHNISAREEIPTNQQAINAALAYDVAMIVGIADITPETGLVVLESDKFNTNFATKSGQKLASAQKFIDDAEELEIYKRRDSDLDKINESDFQNINLLIWIIGAQDANKGNFLVHSEGDNEPKRLKLIDNDISFREGMSKRSGIFNGLSTFTKQMEKPLSEKSKTIISLIKLNKIVDKMSFYGKSENSINATIARINILKALVEKSDRTSSPITLKEIDDIMQSAPINSESLSGWE